MNAKLAALTARLEALVSDARVALGRFRSTVATLAGIGAELIATGLVHGTSLKVVEGLLALATVLGVHVATKATLKDAAK